jgi:hypothetical protein
MAMSKRTRAKGLLKSRELLGAGSDAHEYGIGVIGPDPRQTSAVLLIVLAGAVALSFLFLGVIIIPGVLLVGAIFGAVDRPAAVSMTKQGVAVFVRSEFNGRPRRLLTVLPQGVLTDHTVTRSGGYVHLPQFQLWFRRKEYERLVAGNGPIVASPWPSPMPVSAPDHTSSSVAPNLPSPPAQAAVAAPTPAQSSMAGTQALPLESAVIYCSWCGKQRAVNAQAIHHCGSKERPVVYCMNCGIPFEDGATSCTQCGTPTTQISR